MSYRYIDMANEQMLAKYLDNNFYSSSWFEKYERITDKQQQLLGKDIIVSSSTLNLSNAIIDEKSAAHYVNQDIPTFAFELSTLTRNNIEVEGWLTDPHKQTEYYLLAYPFADLMNPTAKVPEFKKITKVKILLIKRADVLNYLNTKGYSLEKLSRDSKTIRKHITSEDDNNRLVARMKAAKGIWFKKSLKLQEQPINVIIPRRTLESLAILKLEV